MPIIQFKSRKQRDIDEIVSEVRRLEGSGQLSNDTANLAEFISTLPSVKNIKVYTAKDMESLPRRSVEDFPPSMRRQLIRVMNENGKSRE